MRTSTALNERSTAGVSAAGHLGEDWRSRLTGLAVPICGKEARPNAAWRSGS
jgi:hypothetical protein